MENMPSGRGFTEDEYSKYFQGLHKINREKSFTFWAVISKDNQSIIGHAGFIPIPDTNFIQIGFLLDEDYWGKGLATEIGKALIAYAKENLNIQILYGLAKLQNIGSCKALEKIGMTYEGITSSFYKGTPLAKYVVNLSD